MSKFTSCLTHTIRKWNVQILAVAVCLAVCCSNASAQSGIGSIEGTVTDSTGAVIPGASITVVNTATNVTSATKANGVGFYQVPGLFTGAYVVTVTAPNMKTYKQTLDLLVAQNAVINATMTTGAVTQQVTVSASAVQLTNTGSGAITSTLENQRLNQLPMNGRTLQTLVGETTPGLEAGGTRANGLLGQGMEYVGNGAPLNSREFGGVDGQTNLPDPDAVQEVTVEMNNSSALYTMPSTVVITTKSGTNQLHGSFFETARNNSWGIAKNRSNPSNFAAPEYTRNEFGASAGGPIVIPHVYHGKDKSFWFFSYERYSLAQVADYLLMVPEPSWEKGDFSGLVNSSGVLQQLYNPDTTYNTAGAPCNGGPANNYCRTPFPTSASGAPNQIPVARLNADAKILFDITPAPTSADNPLVTSNYDWGSKPFTVVPTFDVRFDHTFNENNKAYLWYQQDNEYQRTAESTDINTLPADGLPGDLNQTYIGEPYPQYAGSISFTHIFSPTFYSETVVSQQWEDQIYTVEGNQWQHDFEQQLGFPNNTGQIGMPEFTGLVMGLNGTESWYGVSQILSNIDENLTKTVGKNQMQFGGRFRHERFNVYLDHSPDEVEFTNASTGLELASSNTSYSTTSNTGNANADMFLGSAYEYTSRLQPLYGHFHDMELDAYFQDNYRMTRNLTVNIGLRYEAHPAPYTGNGLMNSFDLKNDSPVSQEPVSYYVAHGDLTQAEATNMANLGISYETPQEAGVPQTLLDNYDDIFDPRLGIAYEPFGSKRGTVIRGGFGRYAYPIPVRSFLKNALDNAPFDESYSQNYDAANQSPDGKANYLVRNSLDGNPDAVLMGVNSANVVNSNSTTSILPGLSGEMIAPDFAPVLVTQANATVEQALKGNSALRVSWVWSHGVNLDDTYFPNSGPSTYVWDMDYGIVPPQGSVIGSNQYAATATGPYDNTKWGNFKWFTADGESNDNQLQVNYQRLFHRGIAYQITYVWSKPFRIGGNADRDTAVDTVENYVGELGSLGTMTSPYGNVVAPNLPPARPTGVASYANWNGLRVFEEHILDSAIPLHHIQFNGIVDLPFGGHKRFFGNANRALNELAGGWQIAGNGTVVTQDFQPASSNWGGNNPIQVYKHGAPITDCRSGVCHKSYEWFNGYIAPTANASVDCTTNCVSGLPTNWQPYQIPVDNTPGTSNYGNNNVVVHLLSGSTATTAYSPGPYNSNLYSHTFLNGPINWDADASLFKVLPITEKVNLRFNMDAFNVFDHQGYDNPNTTDGTEAVAGNGVSSSYNAPRQVQFTLRLTF